MAQRTAYDETSIDSPRPKLGATNSAPRVGPVLIHEVHHSPIGAAPELEFVEIYNPTDSPVALDRWRLRGNVDFDFTTESIPAGGLLVVVSFSPTDPAHVTAFHAAYGLTTDIPLTGPWGALDTLGLPGECVLYRAGTPPPLEPGYFPLTLEDETDFQSGAPWPDTTNGLSLNRLVPAATGHAPVSWRAATPSPGTLTPPTSPTFAAWMTLSFPEGGAGSDPGDDPDGDGIGNLFEFATGGHPLTPGPSPLPPATVALSSETTPPSVRLHLHPPTQSTRRRVDGRIVVLPRGLAASARHPALRHHHHRNPPGHRRSQRTQHLFPDPRDHSAVTTPPAEAVVECDHVPFHRPWSSAVVGMSSAATPGCASSTLNPMLPRRRVRRAAATPTRSRDQSATASHRLVRGWIRWCR